MSLWCRVEERSFPEVALPTRIKATAKFRHDCFPIKSLLATRKPQRLHAATGVNPQPLKHGQGLWILDDPIRITVSQNAPQPGAGYNKRGRQESHFASEGIASQEK